ncbi:hypothetical protein [Silicimonas algicola]|uniref:BASS family bile acid:Na+ symporter n=1 Tax=Silicimonas algicola TaxID=1826607 RepID=A0A316G6M2_9RHOB|nr:hypothetical protein C8D95_107106 [Silicimonas algicola]
MILVPLHLAARHGRLLLVAGLLAGLTLPALASEVRDVLPALVGGILFLAALRIGPRAALGNLGDIRRTLALSAVFQLVLPLTALGLATALGVADRPLALGLILMLTAPSITGSPNFSALMGYDPAPPMRLLALGTALFPLTALPILWGLPTLGDPSEVIAAALRLLVVIFGATGAGFALRALLPPLAPDRIRALDGLSAIALAVLVVGLMSALGPALLDTPARVLGWLAIATAANLGLQVAAWALGLKPGESLVAGNRNIALFLVALPPETTAPLLIFIGCYQVPMYLTPYLMAPLYNRARASSV